MEAKLANTSGSGCNKSSYNFSVSASCETRTCTRYVRQGARIPGLRNFFRIPDV